MSLTIEHSERLWAENINHKDDVYIYFDSGFVVWSYKHHEPFGVWLNGDLFSFDRYSFESASHAMQEFNSWVKDNKASNCTK